MLRYKWLAVIAIIGVSHFAGAQELFVYSEPASNMPAKSVGIRASNWLMGETNTDRTNYHLIPELMWGVNKHLMLHAEIFLSNRTGGGLAYEGSGIYLKYRFFSTDKVHRHFRIAAIGRLTSNNAPIHQEEITTNGHNSGYQLGLVGTQLLHKTAVSLTTYYEQSMDNKGGKEKIPPGIDRKDISYSLSAGRLILPRAYNNYKQTNLNIMVEALGQIHPESGKQYIDIAPSVQLIFNSQTRLDVGYRHELYSSMTRTAPNGLLLRLEHLLYNVL